MSEAAIAAIAAAVAHVSNAVAGVADRLKNHPNVNDDPQLLDMAQQLEAAAKTLDGIATDPASTEPAPVPAPGSEPAATDDAPPADATNDPSQPEQTPTPETTDSETPAEDSPTDGA